VCAAWGRKALGGLSRLSQGHWQLSPQSTVSTDVSFLPSFHPFLCFSEFKIIDASSGNFEKYRRTNIFAYLFVFLNM
jgi:hypothetical protein